jgi:hypothetical protein
MKGLKIKHPYTILPAIRVHGSHETSKTYLSTRPNRLFLELSKWKANHKTRKELNLIKYVIIKSR